MDMRGWRQACDENDKGWRTSTLLQFPDITARISDLAFAHRSSVRQVSVDNKCDTYVIPMGEAVSNMSGDARKQSFNIEIVEEDGMLWGEVEELPGTFVSGSTLDELMEALTEALGLVLQQKGRIRMFEEVGDDAPVARPKRRRKSPPMPAAHPKSLQVLV